MKSTTALLGYAQPWIVKPGQQIAFKISSNGPETCDVSIKRVICADIDPNGPGEAYEDQAWGSAKAISVTHQHISAGSCALAERVPLCDLADGLVLSLLIFPTLRSDADQVLFSFGEISLRIDSEGALIAQAGSAVAACRGPLELRQWYRLELRIENQRLVLSCFHINAHPDTAELQTAEDVISDLRWPGIEASLLLAAEPDELHGDHFMTRHHYNGKIEAPRLTTVGGTVLAEWDFSHGQSTATVSDSGPQACALKLLNTPMRGVTGHVWDGATENWNYRPEHYAAIHFHDDDCTDCRWKTSLEVAIPDEARSGFYVARLNAEGIESDISFFVSVKPGKPGSRILFLAPTATYQAYANTHIKFDSANTENLYEAPMALSEDELYLNAHRELGLSLYDTHSDDSGVAYASTRRPMLNSRPGLYTFNYVNDTHIVKWLETTGFEYDTATDLDLHCDGTALLSSYDVVITGSHPEYYSTFMWDALNAYQQNGGRHMYLGGNGFYWRIAWSDEFPEVIENRRGVSGVRTWEGEPGEHALSFTGEPGGLWRQNGRAPQKLVGNGFSSTLFVRSTWFKRIRSKKADLFSFVFEGVENEVIGDFGYRGGGCVGLEIDRWEADLGSPANSVILATSGGIDAGGLLSGEEYVTTTRALDGSQNANVRADMVIFATGNGGAVWSTGSIAWATSLLWNNSNNDVSRITKNVLKRFLDPAPLGN